MKKVLLATIVVFVAWLILDWIIHDWLLRSIYEDPDYQCLFRSREEMKMVLGLIVSLLTAFFYAYLYYRYVDKKTVATGVGFGLILGIIWGLSMGYGSYAYQPIPYTLAISWFFAAIIEVTVGGLLIGLIIKEKTAEE